MINKENIYNYLGTIPKEIIEQFKQDQGINGPREVFGDEFMEFLSPWLGCFNFRIN